MRENIKQAEQRSLYIGIFLNFFMAIAGWYVFYLTGMQALLLDGNFSFLSAISCLAAIIITKISNSKSKTFPRGRFMLEPLYAIIKQILTLIILTVSTTDSISAMLQYFIYGNGEKLTSGPIMYYSLLMIAICFALAYLYRNYNKKVNNMSIILTSEAKTSFIDGLLSGGIGIAAIAISFIPDTSSLAFLHYTGDAVVTLILVALSIKSPLVTLAEAFKEFANGVIVDSDVTDPIIAIIQKHIPANSNMVETRIRKVGSSFHINIDVEFNSNTINMVILRKYKGEMYAELSEHYPNVFLHLIPV